MGMGRAAFAAMAGFSLALAAAPGLAQTTPAQTTPAPAGPSQALTITPQAREQRPQPLGEAERRALDLFSSQPALTPSRGLSIGRAYGPQDEDCVRAGTEVFCRQ